MPFLNDEFSWEIDILTLFYITITITKTSQNIYIIEKAGLWIRIKNQSIVVRVFDCNSMVWNCKQMGRNLRYKHVQKMTDRSHLLIPTKKGYWNNLLKLDAIMRKLRSTICTLYSHAYFPLKINSMVKSWVVLLDLLSILAHKYLDLKLH